MHCYSQLCKPFSENQPLKNDTNCYLKHIVGEAIIPLVFCIYMRQTINVSYMSVADWKKFLSSIVLSENVLKRNNFLGSSRFVLAAKSTLFSPNLLVWKFVEWHSFCIVLGELPNTIRKLYLSTNFYTRKFGGITVFFAVSLSKDRLNIVISQWFNVV